MSWWFDDTGRNARRQSCEEVGEREDRRAGKGREWRGREERREKERKGGRGGEGERKTEWVQEVGRMGGEKEGREGME